MSESIGQSPNPEELSIGGPHTEGEATSSGKGSNQVKPLRVAVVGVHGIARHPAGETMNAMADLLMSLPEEGKQRGCSSGRYEPFKAVGIQIPLRPVCLADRGKVIRPKKSFFSLEEGSAKFARYLKPKADTTDGKKAETRQRAAEAADGGTDTGNDYTRTLLEYYEGGADGNVYVTTKLEGERKEQDNAQKTKVDVYEVLWADLAHPESSVVGFFLSLFTLLFHLGSLSRIAVDSAAGEQFGPLWTAFQWAQRWAVRLLQIFLPLFKVLLLIAILSAIPAVSAWVNGNSSLAIGLGGLGGTAAGFFLFKATRWEFGRSPWVWALVVLMPGALGAALVGFALSHGINCTVAASVETWAFVGAPILGFILRQYGNYRNGVQFMGWIGYGLSLGGYFWLLAVSGGNVPMASFWLVEFLVAAIRISWLGMCGLAAVALVLGWLLCWQEKDLGKKARLRGAVRTSRLALALPAASFLLLTSLIWLALSPIAYAISKPRPYYDFAHFPEAKNHITEITQWFTGWHLIPDINGAEVKSDYLHSLLGWALGNQLPITLALIALAFFLLLWLALPSALLERFPPRDSAAPPRSSTNAQTLGLGVWLSRGLDATTVVTALFWCSIFLAFPAVYLLGLYGDRSCTSTFLNQWLYSNTQFIVGSTLAGVSFATLVAIVKYGSSVLETILDVDTYLRTTPENASPRAKIFERFASTLRYLAQYDDGEGGYDSVVIVAHSLGSLISADILRFLYQQKCDPELARFGFGPGAVKKPIRLSMITMGSPIRQLLNRFFPYLYDWVRPQPDNGLKPLPAASMALPHQVGFPATPDRRMLGLERWVNLYRSGDYVGRSLWLDEWYSRTDPANAKGGRYPAPIHKANISPGVQEMCIGAGAHTHYWDDTAPDVAEVLDGLI